MELRIWNHTLEIRITQSYYSIIAGQRNKQVFCNLWMIVKQAMPIATNRIICFNQDLVVGNRCLVGFPPELFYMIDMYLADCVDKIVLALARDSFAAF